MKKLEKISHQDLWPHFKVQGSSAVIWFGLSIWYVTEIEIDFAIYTEDTTTYTCGLQMEKVIEILGKMTKSFFSGSVTIFLRQTLKSVTFYLYILLLNFPSTIMLKVFAVTLPRNQMHYQAWRIT